MGQVVRGFQVRSLVNLSTVGDHHPPKSVSLESEPTVPEEGARKLTSKCPGRVRPKEERVKAAGRGEPGAWERVLQSQSYTARNWVLFLGLQLLLVIAAPQA